MTLTSVSQFIINNVDAVLRDWVRHVRLIPGARGMTLAELEDHGRAIVFRIAADMRKLQSAAEQQERSQGLAISSVSADLSCAEEHARDRVHAGFTAIEILGEYRALRATVTRLWMAQSRWADLSTVYAWTRFHEAVDEQVAEALCHVEHMRAQDRSEAATSQGLGITMQLKVDSAAPLA